MPAARGDRVCRAGRLPAEAGARHSAIWRRASRRASSRLAIDRRPDRATIVLCGRIRRCGRDPDTGSRRYATAGRDAVPRRAGVPGMRAERFRLGATGKG
ncbi:hypothetical protein GCM10022220_62730 [Actinocatenispora rupis]|uniref:Uncharacterized protein n=1 Tax=Actinocatenispora rupis TaxID=519421 RepID=A0A8J3JGJ1_9ACTN|nr:hypothetical protein Aru02nite_63970 [Actinocatenispora rupis]